MYNVGYQDFLSTSCMCVQILAHNIILVMAMYFPGDFTAEIHVSIDKFLQSLALALSDRYR